MGNRLPRFKITRILFLSTATLTLLWLPSPAHAQSRATQDTNAQSAPAQDRQAVQTDDVTRRDLARFDQFLDSHRDIAEQLRRTPSLIDDPQFLQSHPELSAYLEQHPSVKQEISANPDTFMRLEDLWARDQNLRNRDAGGQDRDDAYRRDQTNFDRFLDEHREIAEQVRRNPSLCDNPDFVRNHPDLQRYFQDNPGVRDRLRQDPNAFMQQADLYARDSNPGARYAGGQDRDAYRGNLASFDRFLDEHREIALLVRKNPSLCDDRKFVQDHPALATYLQNNAGVRDQLRQDPSAFMQQADLNNRDVNKGNRDPMHDRMANFGGWLGSHPDVQKDLSRNPSAIKNPDWVQNHPELDAYLNAHPDVRDDLMANPQSFVQGAQQYHNGSGLGTPGGAGVNGSGAGTTGGADMNGHGTGTTGSSTGTSTTTNPAPTTHDSTPKPNQ